MKNQNLKMKFLTLAVTIASSTPVFAQSDSSREAFHQAFDACLSENGLEKPARGQRPSDADRQVLDACLAAKGITRPAGGPHGPRGDGQRPPESSESASNSSQDGGATN